MPTVSVVTPTYNRAQTISAAIESVQQQSFDDYEHLIVDDGSTDDTPEIVRNHAAEDPRITYLRHEDNRGHAYAMNRGLDAAQGRFVSFLDSDDTYAPSRLAVTTERLGEAPADVAGVCHSFLSLYRDSCSLDVVPAGEIGFERVADRNVIRGMSNTMVRTEAGRAIGGFDESLQSSVDYDFQLRLLAERSMLGLERPLSVHRKDVHGVQDNPRKIKQGLLGVLDKHHDVLSERNLAVRLNRIGRATLELGDAEVGLAYLEEAMATCPTEDHAEVARSIGVTHLLNGDERSASRCFLSCLRADPTNYKALASLLACVVPVDGVSAHVTMREWRNRLSPPVSLEGR